MGRACEAAGHEYVTACFSAMGAAAGDFFTKIVTPHYKHLKAAAKKKAQAAPADGAEKVTP